MACRVVASAEQQESITAQWEEHEIPVELRTLYSPYRELSRPIMRFVDEYDEDLPEIAEPAAHTDTDSDVDSGSDADATEPDAVGDDTIAVPVTSQAPTGQPDADAPTDAADPDH